MKQHRINDAWNFIGGWYIPDTLCNDIVYDFELRKEKHFTAHSARGYTYLPSLDMNVDLMMEYEDMVNRVLEQYKAFYKYSHEGIDAFSVSYPWNIQKYEPSKHYSVWHCENNGRPQYRKRHLAFMTYLNDVTDAGETEFLYQNVKIRPEKGLTLIWPAYFTHTHVGIPSPTQEKYVTTGWYEFFDTESFLDKQIEATDEDFWKNLEQMDRNVK